MALRQHEAVALGVVRARDPQHVLVERGDDVGDRERRADVADVRPLRLLEDDAADVSTKVGRVLDQCLPGGRCWRAPNIHAVRTVCQPSVARTVYPKQSSPPAPRSDRLPATAKATNDGSMRMPAARSDDPFRPLRMLRNHQREGQSDHLLRCNRQSISPREDTDVAEAAFGQQHA